MSGTESLTLRAILEECRDGNDGGAFNEVVVMLESTAASAEVFMTSTTCGSPRTGVS